MYNALRGVKKEMFSSKIGLKKWRFNYKKTFLQRRKFESWQQSRKAKWCILPLLCSILYKK